MPCPCKKLKELESAQTFTLPLPIGAKVFVIARYNRNDWYTAFEIEERTINAYEITKHGLSVPLIWSMAYGRYDSITTYCATHKYFTDRVEAEKELERVQAEYDKERW